MPDKSSNPFQFWEELKRRRVVRVIPVYAAAAFVILELVDIISEPLRLPDWTLNFVLILLCIGFVISVILSWVYDVTPEGIQKTKSSEQASTVEVQPASRGWKITSFISILIIIAFVVFYLIGNTKSYSDKPELEKTIAVLPFDNMSLNKEYDHMGDAFTDEIILELQKIKEFERVLSRSSTLQYKVDRPTIPEMAEKLGVNYIIEGSIQRYNEKVSIRVQVIRAKNEDHIWADEYNGKWSDIFSFQDRIAFEVANELKTVLSREEVEIIEKQPTANPEAYSFYLKGRNSWHLRTETDLKQSIFYFNQAIELDSSYALAYAGLADSYFIMALWGWYPLADGQAKGVELAGKALSINSKIAEAHATLGLIALYYDWNWEEAERELKMAISINPNYASAHQWYAELLDILGKNHKARDQIDIALKLSPNANQTNGMSAILYYHNSAFRKAIESEAKVLEVEYRLGSMVAILRCYLSLGMESEAIEQMKKIVSIETSNIGFERLDELYQHSGVEGAIRWFIDWLQINKLSNYYYIASFYAMIQDSDKAFEYLEKAFEMHEYGVLRINNNPDFKFLRNDPRFQSLLMKIGLEK